MRHRIRAISFVRGTNDGPLDCECGESMQASQFSEHRKAYGLGYVHSGRAVGESWRSDSWVRSARRGTAASHGRKA